MVAKVSYLHNNYMQQVMWFSKLELILMFLVAAATNLALGV